MGCMKLLRQRKEEFENIMNKNGNVVKKKETQRKKKKKPMC